MTKAVHLLIVDDHQMIIDGIKSVLYTTPFTIVTVESQTGKEAIEIVKKQQIDIVLLDINLPDISGIEVCKTIKSISRETKILMISMYNEKHILSELLEIGIDGYLIKNTGREELTEAIDHVIENKAYFHPEVKKVLEDIKAYKTNKNIKELPRLTSREKEILIQTANGLSSKEIGEKLSISQYTVEKHKRNMLIKFDLKNTVDLVSFGFKNNLII